MNWEIRYLPEAVQNMKKLDGSQRILTAKAIKKVSANTLPAKEGFVRTSIRKASSQGLISDRQKYGYVSIFRFTKRPNLSIFLFESANKEWLHCVVGHRKSKSFPDIVKTMCDYDIVGGKIANDKTNVTITTYLIGGYGEIGSETADALCISLLIPERLKDQFCFRTKKALDSIEFVGSEKIWVK